MKGLNGERAGGTPSSRSGVMCSEPVVLVVDDSADLRRLVRQTLRGLPVRVEEAVDGDAAWRWIRGASRLHLLITDVDMPGVDGVDLAIRATGRRPELAVIVMSGSEPDAVLERIGERPFSFFRKPVRPSRLLERVAELLDLSL